MRPRIYRLQYLLVWGLIYGVLFIHFTLNPNPVLSGGPIPRIIFPIATLLAVLSAKWHALDSWAFAALSGAAILRAMFYLDPNLPIGSDLRVSAFVLWFGVGVAQAIVARWPFPSLENDEEGT